MRSPPSTAYSMELDAVMTAQPRPPAGFSVAKESRTFTSPVDRTPDELRENAPP
ncbi:hypothetical protein [Streptomyces sp. IBSBF 3352]|uniref:hypothetical protein n=1 Tax=Streptomyces sp. IBSBF 3352 TaxID=2903523 RepID=UPI002FDC5DD2